MNIGLKFIRTKLEKKAHQKVYRREAFICYILNIENRICTKKRDSLKNKWDIFARNRFVCIFVVTKQKQRDEIILECILFLFLLFYQRVKGFRVMIKK